MYPPALLTGGFRWLLKSLKKVHTGKSIEEIDTATSYDHWFTAEEAIEFGLVDAIKFPF